MSEARDSLVELLKAIDRTKLAHKTTVLHAPAAENGWAPLIDLVDLTAMQTTVVMERMDEHAGSRDAELPALTPDISKNLSQKIADRRERKEREAVIREWQASQTRTNPKPGMRIH